MNDAVQQIRVGETFAQGNEIEQSCHAAPIPRQPAARSLETAGEFGFQQWLCDRLVSLARRGYRTATIFMGKNSHQMRTRHGRCGTLPPLSSEARHEGVFVLSNLSCPSAAFCGWAYARFSTVRSRMGSGCTSWLNAVHSL